MKKITLALFLMGSVFVNAQTITQSQSQDIAQGTVSCNAGGIASASNTYYRFFDLNEFNITGAYAISAVQFGIENITTDDGSYPITVRLYATTAAFPAGFLDGTGYTLLAEQTFDVEDQELTVYNAAITATVPAGSDLVVEVGYLADENETATVFLGTNGDGETSPTYLLAPDCGLTDVDTVENATGLDDQNFVMNVVGGTAGIQNNVLSSASLFPNPTTGVVNIKLPNDVAINSASLVDVSGKAINVTVNSNTVNISNVASGVYFLTLNTDKGNLTRKIVKE